MVKNSSPKKENEGIGIILAFLKKNYKFITSIVFFLIFLYWLICVLTPSIRMDDNTKDKINNINLTIQKIEDSQLTLDSLIKDYNDKVSLIDSSIKNIKQQKTIIKEFYHEKIISIDTFGRQQIDSFFTERYKY